MIIQMAFQTIFQITFQMAIQILLHIYLTVLLYSSHLFRTVMNYFPCKVLSKTAGEQVPDKPILQQK